MLRIFHVLILGNSDKKQKKSPSTDNKARNSWLWPCYPCGKMPFRIIALGITAATLLCGLVLTDDRAFAGEPSAVEKALAQLNDALQKDESLARETRDALSGLVEALQEERADAQELPEVHQKEIIETVDSYLEEKGSAVREDKFWTDLRERLRIHGDIRLRHESSFNLDQRRPDRNRQRVRLRLGANYKITDNVSVGARITTGNPDDPNSPYQTLGTIFNGMDISLDRAFVDWRPDWFKDGWIKAGKFGHPFQVNPVYSELVWDADVQPEGIAVGYHRAGMGRMERFDLVAGQYNVLEQDTATDAWATVVQASARLRLTDNLKTDLALGFYSYTDVSPAGSRSILADNAGNAFIDRNLDGFADDYRSKFSILNPIVSFTYDKWTLPVTVSAEYIKNLRADIREDEGWALGVALGNTRNQGDWKVYYQWQVIQQDALFSPVAQDDFLFATNHRSHIFGFNYQLTDKMQTHLWGLASQRDKPYHFWTGGTDQTQWRLRADLTISF